MAGFSTTGVVWRLNQPASRGRRVADLPATAIVWL